MNPYEILGVQPGVSDDDLRRAWRKISKKYHPDNKITGDAKKFMEVTKAYHLILSGAAKVKVKHCVMHDGLFKYKVV